MRTFTTKSYSLLPDAEDARSNGPALNEVILCDGNEKIQLETTIEDIEAFEEDTGIKLENADVIDASAMAQLIEYLNTNRMLLDPL